jgi:HK97 gp10 family phage protein
MPGDYLEAKLTGTKELNAVLKKLPAAMGRRVLTNSNRAGGRVLKKELELRAPRSTEEKKRYRKRRLHESVKVTTVAKGVNFSLVSVHVGSAFYGKFPEWGTKHMPAQPWFRPAYDSQRIAMVVAIQKSLRSNIMRMAKLLAGSFKKSGLGR